MATVLAAAAPGGQTFNGNFPSFYPEQSGEGARGNQGCSRVRGNPRQEKARDGDTLFFFFFCIKAQVADLTMHVWGKIKEASHTGA